MSKKKVTRKQSTAKAMEARWVDIVKKNPMLESWKKGTYNVHNAAYPNPRAIEFGLCDFQHVCPGCGSAVTERPAQLVSMAQDIRHEMNVIRHEGIRRLAGTETYLIRRALGICRPCAKKVIKAGEFKTAYVYREQKAA